MRSRSHHTQREFYSGERDLREHFGRRAQQTTHGENSVRRKLNSTEYKIKIQNSERRSFGYALLESQRELEPQKKTIIDGQPMGRSNST